MPLPPALAARLAKRGIIEEKTAPPQPKPGEEVEEVFAEDYDDPTKPEVPPPGTVPVALAVPAALPEENNNAEMDVDTSEYIHEVTACPNRWNPYHTCVKYCKNRWGLKTFMAENDMLRKRDRMLRKYPLPDGWKEVGDPATGRYYYWSVQTDQVTWLSPAHPKAVISISADKLSGKWAPNLDEPEDQDEEMMETLEEEAREEESDMSSNFSESDSEEEKYRTRREPISNSNRGRGSNRGRRYDDRDRQRGGRRQRDDLDPMDPAAYSDIPRGGWTDGLDTRGSAKTGVDVTASGPLFQQRPYPSPGDILRANQANRKKD